DYYCQSYDINLSVVF
nr:immunoglobulin light chain junction region [Macaca mulatta]